LGTCARRTTKEVAQRLADRYRRSAVELPLVVGQAKL
jgi:hypothetical protein